MSKVCVRKRGDVFQYCFEIASQEGKRKYVSESGFKTKPEAERARVKALNEYLETGHSFKLSEVSYSYWPDNYCKVNLKYRTIEEYSAIVNKYLKIGLGHYRLNTITSYQLNKYLIDVCRRYDYSYGYLKNYKKKQENFKKLYDKKYQYYHLEEVKNKYGKIIAYRIVGTVRKSKLLENLDLVFRKENGIYSGTDIVKYSYKVVHTELGIENCRFYKLRGSYATKRLRRGVGIRDVADILEHSKIEATENYYVSTTEETLKEASEKFEQTVKSDVIDEIIKYE